MVTEEQLDLFDTAPATVAASERPAAIPAPPEAIGAADDAGAHEAGLIAGTGAAIAAAVRRR